MARRGRRARAKDTQAPTEPKKVTLTEGELIVVEYNDAILTADQIGKRVKVTYNGKWHYPIGRFYAFLNPEGILEVIPGLVLKPPQYPAGRRAPGVKPWGMKIGSDSPTRTSSPTRSSKPIEGSVEDILKLLMAATDKGEKRKLRAQLRALGHKGGAKSAS